jgi:nucleotide-binding universal stress UspA family protein
MTSDSPNTADIVERLKAENQRLQRLLNAARAASKRQGRDLLREEADAALPHFTPSWESLRDIAERAGVKSAAWLASRARDLQERGLIESRWFGRERTNFKVWRLKGRPVPIHASGP